jgi:nicotinate-nucleotide adenylyltransferase
MTRPCFEIQQLDDFFTARYTKDKTELTKTLSGKLYFQAVTQLDISATAIRKLIAQKQSPRFLLPDAVIDYITHKQLYEID